MIAYWRRHLHKHPFTCFYVPTGIAEIWLAGEMVDKELMEWATLASNFERGLVIVILRVDGGAGGMRRLFAWLRGVARAKGREIAGFAMRTRLASVERVFERFQGRVTFDEGDGDRRWFAPAEPGVSWLTAVTWRNE